MNVARRLALAALFATIATTATGQQADGTPLRIVGMDRFIGMRA